MKTPSSFLVLTLHGDHSGSSILDARASCPLLQPLRPSCSCFRGQKAWGGRWTGEHPVCSLLTAACPVSYNPSQPCLVLPMEASPPSCLLSALSPWSTRLINLGAPRGQHWQQFNQSLFPEQIVWELCQFLKKICFLNRRRSFFYTILSANRVIHIESSGVSFLSHRSPSSSPCLSGSFEETRAKE